LTRAPLAIGEDALQQGHGHAMCDQIITVGPGYFRDQYGKDEVEL
jgi:hypothetical protein